MMAAVRVTYPTFSPSGEVRPLPAEAIHVIARDVRRQVCGGLWAKPLPAESLIRRVAVLVVNGVKLTTIWDTQHEVHDDEGRPAMGVCEYDPESPGCVMMSLNAAVVGERPDLAISTTAHELGHAIFDIPAAEIASQREDAAAPRRVFRYVTTDEQHFRTAGAKDASFWAEYRANEFMGGLLVPPDLLHRTLVNCAGQLGVPLTGGSDQGSKFGYPLVDGQRWDPTQQDALLDELAGIFGVSPAFIWVRLRKCRLIAGQQ